MDIVKLNEIAWDNEVELENKWTIPVSKEEVVLARKGKFNIFLTTKKSVPREWIGEVENKNILCLTSGGGQQGLIFSALGGNVTVFDNSRKQLEKDEFVAKRDRLNIHIEQDDMRNLSRFENESFDLIFHPILNCFIDDIEIVWKECYRVLKKGGVLLSGFINPLVYIFDLYEWEENDNLVVSKKIPYSDIEQLSKNELENRIENRDTLDFGHSLESQIGGQIKAGFLIAGFYEDKLGNSLLDKHIDTYIATKAIKL